MGSSVMHIWLLIFQLISSPTYCNHSKLLNGHECCIMGNLHIYADVSFVLFAKLGTTHADKQVMFSPGNDNYFN